MRFRRALPVGEFHQVRARSDAPALAFVGPVVRPPRRPITAAASLAVIGLRLRMAVNYIQAFVNASPIRTSSFPPSG